MIRLAIVLTTALVMLIAGGTAQARMVMQTFAVLAGAGGARCLSGAGWHSLVHRAIRRQTRPPRPQNREVGSDCAGPGCSTPWRDCRAGRRRLGYRRWAERDRPRRSRQPRGEPLPATQGAPRRKPQHGNF